MRFMAKSGVQNKYYFVEDYDPSIEYGDGAVISLTPEACYQLKKSGIEYKIVEDIYNEKELKADDDKYFAEQLKWFKDFDRVLKNNVAYCREHNLELARSHYYELKYFVDSITIQARCFDNVISRIGADRIVYVCVEKNNKVESNIYDLCNNRRGLFLKLALLACKKHNVPAEIKYAAIKDTGISYSSTVKGMIKRALKKLHFKSAYYFFKYNKLSRLLGGNRCELNMLFLHSGWLGVDILVRKSMSSGCRIYFRDGNKITLISDVIQKNVLDLTKFNSSEKQKIASDLFRAFGCVMASKEVMGWINDRCGMEVNELVEPYFKGFLCNICIRNITEFVLLKKFYDDKKIDFVIVRSSAEEDSVGPLLAANGSNKRACFQHGIMHDTNVVALTELDLVDHYFAMDGISENYFRDCSKLEHVSECNVSQAPHYLKAISERCKNDRRAKEIVYAPTRIFAGLNVHNVNYYTLTRYYEFQRAVIDLLGNIKDKRFVYKCTRDQEWLDNSVLRHLEDKGYKNIVVERMPLSDCLKRAERLILDYPSTGFYEALAAGVPVMSLWYNLFKMDDRVRSYFGKSIQGFSTISEAMQRIENFINAPSGDFVVRIPLNDRDAIETLKEISSARGKNVAG